ncbi:phosphatidylethanolamine N-methyltransferase, partial [Blyttiomyces sp. JEL0837]
MASIPGSSPEFLDHADGSTLPDDRQSLSSILQSEQSQSLPPKSPHDIPSEDITWGKTPDGIGILLWNQSNYNWIVRLGKRWGFGPLAGKRRGSWGKYFVEELRKKLGEVTEEEYETLPIQFTSWLMFRGLVDVIVANDAVSYFLFAVAYFEYPDPENGITWIDYLRYGSGVVILLFNFWVKLDASREIKDFAWYWGDFFFLIESYHTSSSPSTNGNPDGPGNGPIPGGGQNNNFEMAPHPMYSIGYIGFYATALISKSYIVLLVSLGAHAAQLGFLFLVESPHLEKTYNSPLSSAVEDKAHDRKILQTFFGRDLLVIRNFDWFRSSDLLTLFIWIYSIINAIVIGPIESTRLEDRDWKLWILIITHIYTAHSIHKTLGPFGWFYGDFFIDSLRDSRSLTYTGIYRFLNHPNAWASTASAWGVTLACGSWWMVAVTVFGQLSNWGFVRYVEAPHMRRRYGDLVRVREGDAGSRGVEVVGRVLKGVERRVKEGLSGGVELRRVMSSGPLAGTLVGGRWAYEAVSDGEVGVRSAGVGSDEEDEDLIYVGGNVGSRGGGKKKRERGVRRQVDEEEEDDAGIVVGENDDDDATATFENPGSEGDDEEDNGQAGQGLKERRDSPPRMMPHTHHQQVHGGYQTQHQHQRIQSLQHPHQYQLRSRHPRTVSDGGNGNGGEGPKRVNSFTESMKEAVDRAKPRVRKIVHDARMIVTRRVESLALARNPTVFMPLHLYSLTFPTATKIRPTPSSRSRLVFKLGDPIEIQFTCARETIKRRDWIGIYVVGHNLSTEVTTSKANGRWMFLTGTCKVDDDDATTPLMRKAPSDLIQQQRGDLDEQNQDRIYSQPKNRLLGMAPAPLLLGKTLVTVRTSEEDEGLRVVTGRLKFSGARMPWNLGRFEARYHTDGGYSVVTVSRPFSIVVDVFDWNKERSGVEEVVEEVAERLRVFAEKCCDLSVGDGDRELGLEEDIISRSVRAEGLTDSAFAKYQEEVAKRIVYGIKMIFKIEFSWK